MQKRQRVTETKTQRSRFLEAKQNISKVSTFSILPNTQNRKLGILGKCFFTSNFENCCSLRFRNDKNELRQKFKAIKWIKKKKKASEVSEFSILLYIQNRKLGNLRKCSFTSNFYRDSEALFFL